MDPAPVGGAPLHQISPPIPQGNGLPQAGNGPQPGDGVPAPAVVGPNEAQIRASEGFGYRCVGQPATAAGFYFVIQTPGTNFCGPTAMRHYTGTSFPSIAEFNAEKLHMAGPLLQETISRSASTALELTDSRIGRIVATNKNLGGTANPDEIAHRKADLTVSITTGDPALIARRAEALAQALTKGLHWSKWETPGAIPQESNILNGVVETIRMDAGTVEAGGADPGVPVAMLRQLDPNTQLLSAGDIELPGSVNYQWIFNNLSVIAPNADRAIICVPNHFFTVRKAGNEWHLLEAYSYIGRPAAIHEPEGGTNPYENWPHTEETFMGVIFSVANNVGQTLNAALTPLGK